MIRRLPHLPLLFALVTPLTACATAPAATEATYIFGSCPHKPIWPEAAVREKRQGSVELAFEIDADNTVLDAKVKASSGHPDLDEAARSSLAKCKFKAATRKGMPVRDWAHVTYRWTHD